MTVTTKLKVAGFVAALALAGYIYMQRRGSKEARELAAGLRPL